LAAPADTSGDEDLEGDAMEVDAELPGIPAAREQVDELQDEEGVAGIVHPAAPIDAGTQGQEEGGASGSNSRCVLICIVVYPIFSL